MPLKPSNLSASVSVDNICSEVHVEESKMWSLPICVDTDDLGVEPVKNVQLTKDPTVSRWLGIGSIMSSR